MTGLCGVAGTDRRAVDRIAEGLAWSGDERYRRFETDEIDVRCAVRRGAEHSHPASVGRVTAWLWGNVYGLDGPTGYQSLSGRSESTSKTFARLYDRHGPAVADRLNGDFFGLVYDRNQRTLSFVTDRLGTRDVYYTRTADGTLVFSSRIQSIPDHPAVSPSFDPDYLCEYFAYRRSLGVTTPLTDVLLFPPASVTTYDLRTNELRSEQYWRPRYRPLDRPFSYFVDEFVDRFQTALRERVSESRDGAVLLSGGSDSRLLLAALPDHDLTAYHLTDWMSREARIAERVALTAGVEFEILHRDRDDFRNRLQTTPQMNNFVQRFHQAHAEGFIDRIRAEHDYVLTNHLADVLFKGHYVPNRELPLGPGVSASLPVRKPVRSLEEFLDRTARVTPPYLDGTPDVRTILSNNVERERGGIRYHGVRYDSLRELVLYNRVWPATNGTDTFFRRSLNEHLAHHVPLLDTRILDLWLSIPTKYLLRHDIVNAALTRLAPELAEIPHPNTGVSLAWSFPFDHLGRYAARAARMALPIGEEPPLPTLGHGPWGKKSALVRDQDFVIDTIHEHERVLRRLPCLDWDGALECYREHVDGNEHTRELLALTTFLEMPITEQVVSAARDDGA